jgi:hypothetical protein
MLATGGTAGETPADVSFERAYWDGKSPAQAAAHVRAALRAWKPAPVVKPPTCTSPLTTVSGWWVGNSDPAEGCIRLRKQSPGVYGVEFVADGHEGGWHMHRTATLSRGVLDLSGPLLDYELPPYGRIYAMVVGKERWLVPETAIKGVREAIRRNGCESLPWAVPSALLYAPADSRNQEACEALLRWSPPKQ